MRVWLLWLLVLSVEGAKFPLPEFMLVKTPESPLHIVSEQVSLVMKSSLDPFSLTFPNSTHLFFDFAGEAYLYDKPTKVAKSLGLNIQDLDSKQTSEKDLGAFVLYSRKTPRTYEYDPKSKMLLKEMCSKHPESKTSVHELEVQLVSKQSSKLEWKMRVLLPDHKKDSIDSVFFQVTLLWVSAVAVGFFFGKGCQKRKQTQLEKASTGTSSLASVSSEKPTKSQEMYIENNSDCDTVENNEVPLYARFLEDGKCRKSFTITYELGQGAFGKVYKAQHLLDNQFYAIKVIQMKVSPSEDVRQHKLFREVLNMSKLNSKYTLRYYNCWLESFPPVAFELSDEDSESETELESEFNTLYLYIQTELSPGRTLKEWLSRERKVSREENFLIFRQLLKGVQTIHNQNLIHRDIKPANIFLDEDLNVKIGDFGLATFAEKSNEPGSFSQEVGTPLYSAPEQSKSRFYSQKVDIYPLGLILTELTCNFTTAHEKNLAFQKIRKNSVLPEEATAFLLEAKVISWLTQGNHEKRPDVDQLLQSQLLKDWGSELNLSPSLTPQV